LYLLSLGGTLQQHINEKAKKMASRSSTNGGAGALVAGIVVGVILLCSGNGNIFAMFAVFNLTDTYGSDPYFWYGIIGVILAIVGIIGAVALYDKIQSYHDNAESRAYEKQVKEYGRITCSHRTVACAWSCCERCGRYSF
jgi:protein-S-isoprenylcysteine O-methyltransferase Ste14